MSLTQLEYTNVKRNEFDTSKFMGLRIIQTRARTSQVVSSDRAQFNRSRFDRPHLPPPHLRDKASTGLEKCRSAQGLDFVCICEGPATYISKLVLKTASMW